MFANFSMITGSVKPTVPKRKNEDSYIYRYIYIYKFVKVKSFTVCSLTKYNICDMLTSLVSLQQGNVNNAKKSMKKVNTEGEKLNYS